MDKNEAIKALIAWAYCTMDVGQCDKCPFRGKCGELKEETVKEAIEVIQRGKNDGN